ncbi:hypothetical protein [Erythrobacter sp. CCH5-A1]|jgi:hypothetical protein|uniref:hypothetical protein n=1 Tax=Erythrobacter sp. CCH5-A1 TaxID=1768792 RepID=UPI0008298AF5|nr:hypothetical protein [Erythrobacter sp. CCH5-A1]
MEIFYIVFGLGLFLAGLGYCGWKVWQMGRRGWKDQVWIWSGANRAARFILFILGAQIVVRWVWRGWSEEVLFYLIFTFILVPIPYAAYIIGRLLGMRDRAKNGIRLS